MSANCKNCGREPKAVLRSCPCGCERALCERCCASVRRNLWQYDAERDVYVGGLVPDETREFAERLTTEIRASRAAGELGKDHQ